MFVGKKKTSGKGATEVMRGGGGTFEVDVSKLKQQTGKYWLLTLNFKKAGCMPDISTDCILEKGNIAEE